MVAKPKRQRAVAQNAAVGITRYRLYRKAWERISGATDAGYYLEAITLLESILADRLESRATFLTGKNQGYQNLRPLLNTLNSHETVSAFLPVLADIDAWRERRNEALHEMVKFQLGEHPTWEEKVGPLPRIVRDGKRVLRAFDKLDRHERRKNGARPTATEPAAFRGERTGHHVTITAATVALK